MGGWIASANALVRREVLAQLRTLWAFAVLAVFVLLACIVTFFLWPSDDVMFTRGAMVSRDLIRAMSAVLLATGALIMPALGASSVCIERERETFDLLHLSVMPPLAILMAKIANTVLFFFLLVLAVTPVFGSAFFMVGVETTTVAQVLGIVLMTSLTCALIGTAVSAWSRRSIRAIVVSYAVVGLFMGAGPVVLFFLTVLVAALFLDIRVIGDYMDYCVAIGSPAGALYKLYFGTLTTLEYWGGLVYQGVVGGLCVALAAVGVGRPMDRAPVDNEKPIDDDTELKRRRQSFPFYLIDPLRRKKSIEDGRNPMMVKELRWGLLSRGTVLVRMFYSALFVYFIMGASAFLDSKYSSQVTVISVQLWLTVLIAPALMANSLTKEYELGNIDMLRMTLLRPREVVVGKITAGAVSLSPLIGAVLFSTVPLLILTMGEWRLVMNGFMSLLVCCLLCLALGLFASLLTRRTILALVLSYGLNAAIFLGLAAIVGAVGFAMVQANGRESRQLVQALYSFFSPILAFEFNALTTIDSPGQSPRFDAMRSLGLPASRSGIISPYWIASNAFFTAVGLITIVLSIVAFNRYKMRDE